MQMSSIQVFVYVEGTNVDGYVHGTNCDRALGPMHITYRVVPAKQLPGDAGGKSRLVNYFSFLRENGALSSIFKGKATVALFFMDKDVDDKCGKLLESDNVIYTKFYDVENHVFHEGDVAAAVAAACSLPPNWCRDEFGTCGAWQKKVAMGWRQWTALCFAAQATNSNKEANYGRPSPLNPVAHEIHDPASAESYELKAHKAARAACDGSCDDWHAAREYVGQAYETGRWDEVFKGKWYAPILEKQVLARAPHQVDSKHLAASLVRHVAQTMRFDGDWAESVQQTVRRVVTACGVTAT
ncbi:hypothetical protein AB0O82_02280 [Kitasatospora sp. NPDC088264]|uniref:hypothetical protein n=1 Tax=Kitasatospora sp. NPDC088264 TaxID=3155296 RepID=UPI0034304109